VIPFFCAVAFLNTILSFAVAILPDPARLFSPQLGLCLFSTLLARTVRRSPQFHHPLWFAACVFSAFSLALPERLSTPHALINTAMWWLLTLISWPPGGDRRRRALERFKAQVQRWSSGMPLHNSLEHDGGVEGCMESHDGDCATQSSSRPDTSSG
jgi:hypothetical protein